MNNTLKLKLSKDYRFNPILEITRSKTQQPIQTTNKQILEPEKQNSCRRMFYCCSQGNLYCCTFKCVFIKSYKQEEEEEFKYEEETYIPEEDDWSDYGYPDYESDSYEDYESLDEEQIYYRKYPDRN
ncbi:MAG: hypothetical protein EBU01_13235 [Crocinitomicaceae bacterium]|nr:hypothetical protein [Crocinitomicaceae bacterium]